MQEGSSIDSPSVTGQAFSQVKPTVKAELIFRLPSSLVNSFSDLRNFDVTHFASVAASACRFEVRRTFRFSSIEEGRGKCAFLLFVGAGLHR